MPLGVYNLNKIKKVPIPTIIYYLRFERLRVMTLCNIEKN